MLPGETCVRTRFPLGLLRNGVAPFLVSIIGLGGPKGDLHFFPAVARFRHLDSCGEEAV